MPDTHNSNSPIIIIGAGYSGLSCAIRLLQHGYKVHLLEAAKQPGGRARSIHFKHFFSTQAIDNGQHIMLGAYHETLALLSSIGLKEQDILIRQRLKLNLFAPDKTTVRLITAGLPAPLHLLFALLTMQGVKLNERLYAIRMAITLAFKKFHLTQDISVLALLKQYQQSPKCIQALWQPLCLATMNTPIHYASAQIFLNVLRDCFSKHKNDADLLFFKYDLSTSFSTPACQYIVQHNGRLSCASRVSRISIIEQNNKQQFIVKTKQQSFSAQTIVLATPAHVSRQLLDNCCHNKQSLSQTHYLQPHNSSLDYYYEPICTVYLQYPDNTQLPEIMLGFYHSLGQWAIDRRSCQQNGLIAVVISGPGKHLSMNHQQLVEAIHIELKLCIKDLQPCLDYRVVTEQRATFSCRVDISQQRPLNETQIPGLLLAGDYTASDYPATIEAAVRSGLKAAELIISQKKSEDRLRK